MDYHSKMSHAVYKGHIPVTNGQFICFTNERFIEKGKMGAFGGGGKLAAGDGIDGAAAAEMVADGEGKLVQAGAACVAIMIEAGGEAGMGKDLQDGGGQVGGIGGGAQLVVDNVDGWALLHEADHGLYEVVAEFGIDPGCPDDAGAAGVVG